MTGDHRASARFKTEFDTNGLFDGDAGVIVLMRFSFFLQQEYLLSCVECAQNLN